MLGMLLFTIYINDLFLSHDTVLFADDAIYYTYGRNLVNLFLSVNETEERPETWCNANKLKLNREKTPKKNVSCQYTK